jgi:hypothetical protein
MAKLSEIVRDPNFVNANEATKAAIFNKWAPQDPDYSGANPATQAAIRQKYGILSEVSGEGGADIAPPPAGTPPTAPTPLPPMSTGVPAWARRFPALYGVAGAVRETAGPVLEGVAGAVGGAAGGLAGSAVGPVGTATGAVGGAGLGYGMAKQVTRFADRVLGNEEVPTVGNAMATAAGDVLMGATTEAAGRGVITPIVNKAFNYASKVKNLKLENYLEAAEGRGREIVNALRAPRASAVPGAAPTAGEVAAPVSGTKFATLQATAEANPQMATRYAEQAAQTNQARLAQEGRVASRFKGVIDRVRGKIDRGLVDVSQKEVGEALTSFARAEQEAVKQGVVRPAYEEAFKLAGPTKINVGGLVDEAEAILQRPLSSYSPETSPNVVRVLMRFKPKPGTPAPTVGKAGFRVARPSSSDSRVAQADLRQLDDLRKAINADIAAAKVSNDPSAQMTLRNLGKLHDKIDEAVQESATITPEAKAAYQKALDTYRNEYVPRFKTGVNANLFKTTNVNEQKILADDVVSRYFTKGGEREADQFIQMFGQNPEALKVARAGIEDTFRRQVTDATGNVVPAKVAQFMKDYAKPITMLDEAGMNLGSRFDIIAKDAARLAKIQDMAKASGNKLSPALPPGANAAAVERRIGDLTKGLTPRQLSAVDAVRKDVAREVEAARLAAAGQRGRGATNELATAAGKEAGLPLPMLLSSPITLFNNVFKRLTGHLDDKLAYEIAREMSSPAMAAQSMEKALKLQDKRAAVNAMIPRVATTATMGATVDSQNSSR